MGDRRGLDPLDAGERRGGFHLREAAHAANRGQGLDAVEHRHPEERERREIGAGGNVVVDHVHAVREPRGYARHVDPLARQSVPVLERERVPEQVDGLHAIVHVITVLVPDVGTGPSHRGHEHQGEQRPRARPARARDPPRPPRRALAAAHVVETPSGLLRGA